MRYGALWGILVGAAGALVLVVVSGLVVIYSGMFNVAASAGHSPLARWMFSTAMENSVRSRAKSQSPPRAFTAADLTAGAHEYKEMCQGCHGGPGMSQGEWAKGMTPGPPDLGRAAKTWETREVFWIVKHGLKMTAMPSFGETHDDPTLWNIAAFVKQLPQMTPVQYAAYGAGEHEAGGHEAGEHRAGEHGQGREGG